MEKKDKIDVKIELNKNEIKENHKDKTKYLIILIIIIIIYFAIVISTEITYREKLFKKSITIQEKIRKKHDKDSAFYKCFQFFSDAIIIICFTLFVIIYLFFPLSSSFLVFQSANFANYIVNLFKIIYRSPRPYWESTILDTTCETGYGNPSGHSLVSVSFFFVMAHIYTNFNFFRKTNKGKFLRIIIFFFFICLAYLIVISRLLLSAHSMNQIIYGSLLGIGVYFLEIYILSYHTYSSEEFIQHMTKIRNVIIYMILYVSMLILLIIIYFSVEDNKRIERQINKNVYNGIKCNFKRKFELLKLDGFTKALTINSLIGGYLGIVLLIHFLKKLNFSLEYVNIFNRSSPKRWLIRLPILILSGIFFILYIAIPKSSPISIIVIFKFALAFFLTGFGIYFPGIFICIYCNFGNENIKKIE